MPVMLSTVHADDNGVLQLPVRLRSGMTKHVRALEALDLYCTSDIVHIVILCTQAAHAVLHLIEGRISCATADFGDGIYTRATAGATVRALLCGLFPMHAFSEHNAQSICAALDLAPLHFTNAPLVESENITSASFAPHALRLYHNRTTRKLCMRDILKCVYGEHINGLWFSALLATAVDVGLERGRNCATHVIISYEDAYSLLDWCDSLAVEQGGQHGQDGQDGRCGQTGQDSHEQCALRMLRVLLNDVCARGHESCPPVQESALCVSNAVSITSELENTTVRFDRASRCFDVLDCLTIVLRSRESARAAWKNLIDSTPNLANELPGLVFKQWPTSPSVQRHAAPMSTILIILMQLGGHCASSFRKFSCTVLARALAGDMSLANEIARQNASISYSSLQEACLERTGVRMEMANGDAIDEHGRAPFDSIVYDLALAKRLVRKQSCRLASSIGGAEGRQIKRQLEQLHETEAQIYASAFNTYHKKTRVRLLS